MAEIKLPDFIIAPIVVLRDNNVRTIDGLVYGVVYWFTRLRNEKCTASNRVIAKILNCSDTQVSHSLTRLNRAGYIQIRLDENNHREEIIPLVAFSRIDDPSTIGLGGSTNVLGGVVQMDEGPSTNGLQNKNIEEEKENKKTPLPPKGGNIGLPDDTFGNSHKIGGRPEENPNRRVIANSAKSAENIWQEFFDHYLAESGEKRTKATDGRKSKLRIRLQTFTLDEIKQAVTNAFSDDFYSGDNNTGWRADIDYFLRSDEVLDRLMRLKPRKKSHIMLEE